MKSVLISAISIAVTMFAVFLVWTCTGEVTTQSLSPDETYRIYLIETGPNMPGKIDRNFKLVLATLDSIKSEISRETIFVSPDEGKPIGSERFVWSKDGEYVLLVGKHFAVAADIPLGYGEQIYFLYHVPAKQSWCNSRQTRLKLLTEDELLGIDFCQPDVHQRAGNHPK